jgi:site-specific recombinase XerD
MTPLPLTCDEAEGWQAAYLDACALHLAPETVDTYRKRLKQFVAWWRSEQPATPFTRELGYRYQRWLNDHGTPLRSQGLALSIVRAWGTFLVAQGRLAHNPWLHLQGPGKITTLATNFLSYSQIKRLLAAFDRRKLAEHRDAVIVYLMLKTALRETELSRARIGHLQPFGPHGGTLTVRSKGKKRKPEETVVLVPKAWAALQAYLAEREKRAPLRPDAPLFTTVVDGEERAITPHEMRRRIRLAYQRAGIPTKFFSALSLRHTAAMQALLKQAPLRAVQTLMRHEDLATTKRFADQLARLQHSGAQYLDHY